MRITIIHFGDYALLLDGPPTTTTMTASTNGITNRRYTMRIYLLNTFIARLPPSFYSV
jgi:hypothetical protein